MTTLRREALIERLRDRTLTVADARRIDRRLAEADENGDGTISGAAEWQRAVLTLDRLDRDGNALTLDLGTDARPSAVGRALRQVEARARPATTTGFRDPVLARLFPAGLTRALRSGARGDQVTALQHALMRTGDLHRLVDGTFGPSTTAAVRAFQARNGLTATGEVDQATLAALDRGLAALPAPSIEPMAALDDFAGLTPIALPTGSIDWNNDSVQAAWRTFVGEFWPRMRAARVECDCKTVALFLVERFRRYFQAQTGSALPMPTSADGSRALPDTPWRVITAGEPRGFFERTDRHAGPERGNYRALSRIEAIDPTHSMIYGVNLRQDGVYADDVFRIARVVDGGTSNGGDRTRPEIDLSRVRVGDLIFMNHNRQPETATGPDRRIDHCMTIVGVTDLPNGGRRIVIAVGSFDDVTDQDSTTPPSGPGEINMYAEELTVTTDARGSIVSSETTWTSEPDAVVTPRYDHTNTVMELNPGSSICVSRFATGTRR